MTNVYYLLFQREGTLIVRAHRPARTYIWYFDPFVRQPFAFLNFVNLFMPKRTYYWLNNIINFTNFFLKNLIVQLIHMKISIYFTRKGTSMYDTPPSDETPFYSVGNYIAGIWYLVCVSTKCKPKWKENINKHVQVIYIYW